jgi:hypothetical protein
MDGFTDEKHTFRCSYIVMVMLSKSKPVEGVDLGGKLKLEF